jgi:TolB-like protein
MRLLIRVLIICLSCMLFLPACGGKSSPSYYINQDIDFSYIKTVAVLPLDNLTNDRFAGESVRQVVISELLASGLVDCICPGDVMCACETVKMKAGQPPTAEQIKAIGKTLKVQAVIFGTVNKYGEIREGNVSAPEVSITLMMADTNSGSIIWSVTKTCGGADFWAKHFGVKGETMSGAVLRVVRESIQTLRKR